MAKVEEVKQEEVVDIFRLTEMNPFAQSFTHRDIFVLTQRFRTEGSKTVAEWEKIVKTYLEA